MRALPDYYDDLARCTSMAAVGEVFRRGILEQGYTASVCSNIAATESGPQVRFMFRNMTPAWQAFCDHHKVGVRSPSLAAARRRLTSFSFIEVFDDSLEADQREVWHTVRAWGWQNGFVVPVHGPGGYFSYLSFASPERDLNLSPTNRAEIHMFSLLAHERCHALSDFAAEHAPRRALGERELECMRWVAAGKTDWEIGEILSISATTVKFHVNGARAKLGARTRAQAVARLVLSGLY
jgi:DNA-binding CsgD family transcriptional regulator